MRKTMLCVAILATLALAQPGLAAPKKSGNDQPIGPKPTVTISTGPGMGVYTQGFSNMQEVCGDKVELVEIKSSGAAENLNNCITGKAMACFVNADHMRIARDLEGRGEEVKNLRTILPFYDNAIHMVARDGKIVNFGDLHGKRIGTSGGAAITLKMMLAKSGNGGSAVVPASIMNYDKEIDPTKAAVKALKEGKVDVVVGIGYAPVPWAAGITDFDAHLVEYGRMNNVSEMNADSSKTGYVYKAKGIYYKNLGGNVQTLAVRTILVSAQQWGAGAKEHQAVRALFKCMSSPETISKLKQGVGDASSGGYHPFWKTFSPLVDPAWPWYGNLN